MNFQLPQIGLLELLTVFIIPIILFSFAIKSILEKIRIFNSGTVNWGIALMISLSTIYFLRNLSFYITGISILAICLFKINGGKKYLIGITATIIYFLFVLPFLKRFLV